MVITEAGVQYAGPPTNKASGDRPSAPTDILRRTVRFCVDLRAGCRPVTRCGAAPTSSAEPSD